MGMRRRRCGWRKDGNHEGAKDTKAHEGVGSTRGRGSYVGVILAKGKVPFGATGMPRVCPATRAIWLSVGGSALRSTRRTVR